MSGLTIKKQLSAGKYTVLCFDNLDSFPPTNTVKIDGVEYKTEIVYDLPNAIGIVGNGSFEGKNAEW